MRKCLQDNSFQLNLGTALNVDIYVKILRNVFWKSWGYNACLMKLHVLERVILIVHIVTINVVMLKGDFKIDCLSDTGCLHLELILSTFKLICIA